MSKLIDKENVKLVRDNLLLRISELEEALAALLDEEEVDSDGKPYVRSVFTERGLAQAAAMTEVLERSVRVLADLDRIVHDKHLWENR